MAARDDRREQQRDQQIRTLFGARINELWRRDHLNALYQPLLTPQAFFSHLDEHRNVASPGLLILFWGIILGLVDAVFFAGLKDLPALPSGLPSWVIGVIFGIMSTVLASLGLLLITFLAAVPVHVMSVLAIRGYHKNLLVSWQIVAYLTVPLVVGSLIIRFIGLVPFAGGLVAAVFGIALLLAALHGLWTALQVVHSAGPVRAAIAAIVSMSPLIILFAIFALRV